MRVDAQSLLDRLGKSDFAYREFADRFSDMELWPAFEALLRDPRLHLLEAHVAALAADAEASAEGAEPAGEAPVAAAALTVPAPVPAPVAEPVAAPDASEPMLRAIADLFSQYDQNASQGDTRDVRSLLKRLSDLEARGSF